MRAELDDGPAVPVKRAQRRPRATGEELVAVETRHVVENQRLETAGAARQHFPERRGREWDVREAQEAKSTLGDGVPDDAMIATRIDGLQIDRGQRGDCSN